MTGPADPFKGFATEAIHAANLPDRSSTPIYLGATNQGEYTREWNPTIEVLENTIARLERGEAALAAACGAAAIAQTLLTVLQQGGRLVYHRCLYTGSAIFFEKLLPQFGIEAVALDLRDLGALKEALATPTQVVYGETIANPNLEVIDLQAVSEVAHEAGAEVVIDSTFATPYLCRPLELGVDIVLHSATKYLCGHGDALAGLVVGDKARIDPIRYMMTLHGGILSPFNAFLILRGIKTLALRMEGHGRNARRLAEFLQSHPQVERVRYPGLPDDSEHAVAAKQMRGFGGVIGFHFVGGQEAAEAFPDQLKIAKPWVSLGDVETLVIICKEWKPAALPGAYARVAVGLEDVDDIIADFDQALNAIA